MELIIFVGLQAAGKSTFYRTRFAETHTHVSKDLLRNNKRRSRRQLQLVEEALQVGRSVVVDNTNPTQEDRAALIQLGKQYGAQVIGYFFEIELQKSLERNEQRTGKERVPKIGIFAALKRMTPPNYEEGFDTLYRIRAREQSEFEISVF